MSNVSIDISSRIQEGHFDLEEMIGLINYYHIHSELTAEERENLIEAARAMAEEALEVDPKSEILALWTAVRALQDEVALLRSGATPQTPLPDSFPDFVQPTGAHNAYNAGQGTTYNGKHYRSLIDGNVWSPDTYPAGWEEAE